MKISTPTPFGTPNVSFGTAVAAGSSGEALRTDDTLLLYDTTVPEAVGPSSSVGDTSTAARRNHTHAGVAPITSVDETIARYTGTGGALQGYTSGAPVVSDTGDVTLSAQPTIGFYADSQANVTGNNTFYDTIWANEIWDIGDNFSTPTFTAPVGGKYLVNVQVDCDAVGSASKGSLIIETSNRTWLQYDYIPSSLSWVMVRNQVVDLDTNDELKIQLHINGTGADTVDILGGSSMRSCMTIWKVG